MKSIQLKRIYEYKGKEYKVDIIITHKRKFLFWKWEEDHVIYYSSYGVAFSRELKDFTKTFTLQPKFYTRDDEDIREVRIIIPSDLRPGEGVFLPVNASYIGIDPAKEGADKSIEVIIDPDTICKRGTDAVNFKDEIKTKNLKTDTSNQG